MLWEQGGLGAKASGSCWFGSQQKPLTAFGCGAKRRVVPGHTNRRSAAAPHALELQPWLGGKRRHNPVLLIPLVSRRSGYCRGQAQAAQLRDHPKVWPFAPLDGKNCPQGLQSPRVYSSDSSCLCRGS